MILMGDNIGMGDDNIECGQKFAIAMVIDVSGSMCAHVDKLSESFNSFLDAAKADYKIANKADVAVITFNSDVYVNVPFNNISAVGYQHFTASGGTSIAAAMEKANELVRERTREYNRNGIRAYKPWIVLMTDGYSGDSVDSIAATLKQRERDGKVRIFALGMGTGFDKSTLAKFTDKTLAITDWDFEQFFGWLGRSVAVVSTSTPGSSNQQICSVDDDLMDMSQQYNKFIGTM